jgi:hypothetical protein
LPPDLPNPADRDRIANTCGIPPRLFDRYCTATFTEPFNFLLYSARENRMWKCPKLEFAGVHDGERAR